MIGEYNNADGLSRKHCPQFGRHEQPEALAEGADATTGECTTYTINTGVRVVTIGPTIIVKI